MVRLEVLGAQGAVGSGRLGGLGFRGFRDLGHGVLGFWVYGLRSWGSRAYRV